jgi:hypothetical protein
LKHWFQIHTFYLSTASNPQSPLPARLEWIYESAELPNLSISKCADPGRGSGSLGLARVICRIRPEQFHQRNRRQKEEEKDSIYGNTQIRKRYDAVRSQSQIRT